MSSDTQRLLFSLPRISRLACGDNGDVSGYCKGSDALGWFVLLGVTILNGVKHTLSYECASQEVSLEGMKGL